MASTIKLQSLVWLLALSAAVQTEAALYTYSGSSYAIPDGNPNGAFSTIAVGGAASSITHIGVNFNISGGYNGDLYGYLSYNGVLVTLLNRVGTGGGDSFGYGDAGFNVSLDDGAAHGIHNYLNYSDPGGGVLTGTWSPDGGTLASFNGQNPNGTWSLFFADLSGGGGQATLNGWSLDITAVPEPVNVALGVFAGLLVLSGLWRANRFRRTPGGCSSQVGGQPDPEPIRPQ